MKNNELESHYQRLIYNLPDAVFFLDRELFVSDLNVAAHNLSNKIAVLPDEATKEKEPDWRFYSFTKLFPWLSDEVKTFVKSSLETTRVENISHSQRHFEAIFSRWIQNGVVLILRDTTMQEFSSKERSVLLHQLIDSRRLETLGKLADSMAHDFNNLLTVIGGYSSLLLTTLDEGDPMKSDVGQIFEASERAAHLTRRVLSYSRSLKTKARVVDLAQAAHLDESMMRRLLRETIDLNLEITKEKILVEIDPVICDHLLINVMVATQEAIQSGAMTLKVNKILIDETVASEKRRLSPGHYAVVSVAYAGRPPFHPLSIKERVDTEEALNSGLATLQNLVEFVGGHFEANLVLENAGAFAVYLPLYSSEETTEPHAVGILPRARENECVLLVEDEDLVRQFAKKTLIRQGYVVIEASNGMEALRIFEHNPQNINLILTDVIMPQLSGPDFVLAMEKKRHNKIPVLFMSGYSEMTVLSTGMANQHFLPKPFSAEILATRVREILDTGKAA